MYLREYKLKRHIFRLNYQILLFENYEGKFKESKFQQWLRNEIKEKRTKRRYVYRDRTKYDEFKTIPNKRVEM